MSTPDPTVPSSDTEADWWRQAVVYQVYPRSFADADGDGTGDIAGITSRVPHLADLGVDAIWLSPFYPSPLADGGYDVADFRDVDPRFGTLSDLEELLRTAHRAGLKVVVDIVPNHTSSQHPWFREALVSPPGSRARDRYVFRAGSGADGSSPPSDWTSNFGGSAWERVDDGQWYLHLFDVAQPDLNWENPEVREDFRRTLRFWSDLGVDGFRVDMAHALVKDLTEPLRSQTHLDRDLPLDGSDPLYDRDEVHEIFADWRTVLDEYDPPRSAVAEAWVPAPRRVRYAHADELGQAFNFDLLEAPWSAAAFRDVIAENLAQAQVSRASSTWVLSNHDVVRHPSRYGLPEGTDLDAWLLSGGSEPAVDRERGRRRAHAATLLLLGLPGSVYLYQGEELGLFEVADLPFEVLQDPKWEQTGRVRKGRDGCRVPLPWTPNGPSFGFGGPSPWLPQPRDFGSFAASEQVGDPNSTFALYRAALAQRARLQVGEELRWSPHERADVVAFHRHPGWAVTTNFGSGPVELPHGEVLLASRPLVDGLLPGEATAWVRPPHDAV